jgi:CHAT domain-containing protein
LFLLPFAKRIEAAMRLRALRSFLLPVLFAIAVAPLPAVAQSPSDAELKAMNSRVIELYRAGKYGEAIPLAERYAAATAARSSENAPEYAAALNNLVVLLQHANRLAEAEHLMRRALVIVENSFGPEHPDVAIKLNNLAQLLKATNRLAEAEPLMRRVLAIYEKSFGPGHPNVALALNNLAQLLQATNRLTEAEPLMRRVLAIDKKSFGAEHPDVARDLNNLATLLAATSRLSEAEPLMRRALAIDEKSFGAEHPDVGIRLNNLATLLECQGRWLEAVALYRKAKPIMTGAHTGGGPERGGLGKAILAQNASGLRADARALYRAGAGDFANRAEGFELAQWAMRNDAADALSAMALRFARGSQELAKLVREEQDLLGSSEGAYRSLDAAAGKADAKAAEAARSAIADIEAMLAEKRAALRQAFPDYVELSNPKPLPLSDVQALLGEREALLLFLDLPRYGRVPEETIVFALTKKQARWTSIGQGSSALRERVTALRCGLDSSNWRLGKETREVCKALLGIEGTEDQVPPFDAAAAYALYRDLFSGIEDLIQNKQLLIVPSGALTQLPFEVLLTSLAEKEKYGERVKKAGRLGAQLENIASSTGIKITQVVAGEAAEKAGLKPNDIILSLDGQAFNDTQRLIAEIQSHTPGAQVSLHVLRDGSEITLQATLAEMEKREWIPRFLGENEGQKFAWLGERQAITILPSVGSLKALRAAKASEAPEPFAGFGNPLLTGLDGADKSAWAKQDCGKPAPPKRGRIASIVASIASLFRGGAVDVEDLRRQPPLPETADELCAVARGLGAPEAGLGKAVYLGERATVSMVKALSKSGDLARARVVHFATHGLLAGETAMFAKAKAEPALLLTPPAQASDEDNGLLTASEVAQLNLNADWVVMSACNTAGGSAEGAEALSGLARAFFYAGARALLVSHWAVDSEAAVSITTGAVNAMKANPKIGRAEALRSAEAALIARGGRFAHPSVWAPFVLVGNGGQ